MEIFWLEDKATPLQVTLSALASGQVVDSIILRNTNFQWYLVWNDREMFGFSNTIRTNQLISYIISFYTFVYDKNQLLITEFIPPRVTVIHGIARNSRNMDSWSKFYKILKMFSLKYFSLSWSWWGLNERWREVSGLCFSAARADLSK